MLPPRGQEMRYIEPLDSTNLGLISLIDDHIPRPMDHLCYDGPHVPSPIIFFINKYPLLSNPSFGKIMEIP